MLNHLPTSGLWQIEFEFRQIKLHLSATLPHLLSDFCHLISVPTCFQSQWYLVIFLKGQNFNV